MRLPIALVLALAACSTRPASSTPKGGAGDCRAQSDVASCQDAAGCRWLSPGCAEGDEVAFPADATGCYPATDPCNGTNCADGTKCSEVVVNPCLPNAEGVACDACGETIRVCLPKS